MTKAPTIGSRVEIPVHYDLWMRGARFGVVVAVRYSLQRGTSRYCRISMDHPAVRKPIKVWEHDWPYMKELS